MTRTTRACRSVIIALLIGGLASTFSFAQSSTEPRSNQGSGESAAGKNDSSTGKEEGERAREIMQTQRPLALSQEQRRKIQDFVASRPGEKAGSVNFSLTIGAAVPRQAQLSDLPRDLTDTLQGYNGDQYVIVKDQFVIVDKESRRVIAIVPLI
jgi:hypothetical protein